MIKHVYWDKCELAQVPKNTITYPQASGTPTYYAIDGKKLYIYPVPTSQDELYIEYKAIPSFASGATGGDSLSTLIPDETQMGIAYWVAAELLKGSFEEALAKERYKDYYIRKSRYIMLQENNATSTRLQGGIVRPYKVIT